MRRLNLTPREHQITHLLSSGMTQAAVAIQLHLSRQTVKNHLSAARNRNGLPNSMALVAAYLGGEVVGPNDLESRVSALEAMHDRHEH